MNAYYNTGEVRSVNGDATWTSASTYLTPTVNPINLDMPKSDAIVVLQFNPAVAKQATVTFDVKHAGFATKVRFVNVP